MANKISYTFEKVDQEIGNLFSYELKMYCYHKLNGRDAEAETYLETYKQEQANLKKEFDKAQDSQALSVIVEEDVKE